ncbi:MAG: hypothetical protein EOO15_00645 [Chitinophagaceae bacterium]|nr:MAG: hypothetical protein EOO15_00645 [Chitinophagaceae bacterium]
MRLLLLLLILSSCVGGSSRQDAEPPSTVDSQTLRVPLDPGPQIDTDDHNRPSTEGITLDSPVGPAGRDTSAPNR